ncbi:MAG TPA: hypothetical protein VNS59_04775, partial [Lysobacter sp.]|nr:hypothetical protein [Lysobacter sp.]
KTNITIVKPTSPSTSFMSVVSVSAVSISGRLAVGGRWWAQRRGACVHPWRGDTGSGGEAS